MSDRPSDFYVGYRPLPPRDARLLRAGVPLLCAAVLALGAAAAALQRDAGAGSHDTAAERTWTGTIFADPYPMLVDDAGSAMLVVQIGKLGASARARAFDGRAVTVRGYLIERSARRMIELADGDDAITATGAAARPSPTLEPGDAVVLRGEVLDAKCYLGAMKPGDGKAHKACATLCIEGGIPPMFFAKSPAGREEFLLLDAHGSSARDAVLAFLGEPVTLRGRRASVAGLSAIFIDPDGVSRLE